MSTEVWLVCTGIALLVLSMAAAAILLLTNNNKTTTAPPVSSSGSGTVKGTSSSSDGKGFKTTASYFNTSHSQDGFKGGACGDHSARDPSGYNTAISDAFCASLGVSGTCVSNVGAGDPTGALCGKYLAITNADTGKSLRVMVVDRRGSGEGHGLDLSLAAFQALDTDGGGKKRGFLNLVVTR